MHSSRKENAASVIYEMKYPISPLSVSDQYKKIFERGIGIDDLEDGFLGILDLKTGEIHLCPARNHIPDDPDESKVMLDKDGKPYEDFIQVNIPLGGSTGVMHRMFLEKLGFCEPRDASQQNSDQPPSVKKEHQGRFIGFGIFKGKSSKIHNFRNSSGVCQFFGKSLNYSQEYKNFIKRKIELDYQNRINKCKNDSERLQLNEKLKKELEKLNFDIGRNAPQYISTLIMESLLKELPVDSKEVKNIVRVQPRFKEENNYLLSFDLISKIALAAEKGDLKELQKNLELAKAKEIPISIDMPLAGQEIKEMASLPPKIVMPDREGKNALLLAAENGHTRIMELLIQQGASLNAQDKNGNSALMIAIANGKTNAIHYLLQQPIDIDHKNNSGENALAIARKYKHVDVIKKLFEIEFENALKNLPREKESKKHSKNSSDLMDSQASYHAILKHIGFSTKNLVPNSDPAKAYQRHLKTLELIRKTLKPTTIDELMIIKGMFPDYHLNKLVEQNDFAKIFNLHSLTSYVESAPKQSAGEVTHWLLSNQGQEHFERIFSDIPALTWFTSYAPSECSKLILDSLLSPQIDDKYSKKIFKTDADFSELFANCQEAYPEYIERIQIKIESLRSVSDSLAASDSKVTSSAPASNDSLFPKQEEDAQASIRLKR